MTPQRYQRVIELFQAASDWGPDARPALLAEACAGDDDLRREVEAMLAADARSGGFLDQPADDFAAAAIAARETGSLIGHRVSHYEVISVLGAGGMGEVYRANDTRLHREVAIKFANASFSDRFEREARTIAALNHPNICTLHDVGPNYLVMELVEGETLAERIKRGAVPWKDALSMAKQIADALEAAHERGIIHRDLKPANIKIKPDGTVKVLDFGLAKMDQQIAPGDSPRTTRPGLILGTAAYMSPEQARGNTVDKRADIWAFGAVLYEMLTGQRAFPGDTTTDILAAVVTREPEWERAPVKVRRLLRRCLEKDPERRLRHIGDFELLLEEAPGPSNFGRGRLLWAVAATVLAIIAVGSLWVARRATPVAQRPLIRLTLDLGANAASSLNSTVVISPDSKRIVFPARGPQGKRQLATRLLDQAHATFLPGTEDGSGPFFSPDGQWVGFLAANQLKKISILGGAPVTLCAAAVENGAGWGEDGYIVAALSNVAGLWRVPATGGTPQPLTYLAPGEATHRWPQILPGGNAVLFTASRTPFGMDAASIEVMQLKTGVRKTLLRDGYFGRYLPSNGPNGHLVYIHQGVLFVVGFDPTRLESTGTPMPFLEDVSVDPVRGSAQFDFSAAPSSPGTFIYFEGQRATQSWPVVLLDSFGKTEPLVATPGVYSYPRFSPDGKRLALTASSINGNDLFIYDFQREAMTRLTFTGQAQVPVWTPDGKHIAFRSISNNGFGISWIRADGAGEAQTLLVSRDNLVPYSFFPDGRLLAYQVVVSATVDSDIWTLPLDTSDLDHPKPGKPKVLLHTPYDENMPAFSPDGRWIAYRSDESGTTEIYVRPFWLPGGKWQISTSGGLYAMWSNANHELFYETLDNRIAVVNYTVHGDSFVPGRPRLWSQKQIFNPGLTNLDLARDGKRFAVFPRSEAMGEGTGSVRVTFLLNIFDELRRRAPAGK
ncbi:MAG TPA: protein kinase [Bryobacteraceae bacterium]|jgi:hypothetical protein|nr:protein kinase [Bryobacteraceae bacterium]